jgi:hypothetical protein
MTVAKHFRRPKTSLVEELMLRAYEKLHSKLTTPRAMSPSSEVPYANAYADEARAGRNKLGVWSKARFLGVGGYKNQEEAYTTRDVLHG